MGVGASVWKQRTAYRSPSTTWVLGGLGIKIRSSGLAVGAFAHRAISTACIKGFSLAVLACGPNFSRNSLGISACTIDSHFKIFLSEFKINVLNSFNFLVSQQETGFPVSPFM